jgi:hypothetical protein
MTWRLTQQQQQQQVGCQLLLLLRVLSSSGMCPSHQLWQGGQHSLLLLQLVIAMGMPAAAAAR